MKQKRTPTNNQRGFFTIWVSFLAIALLFVGGITVDFWRITSARSDAEALADAAAIAGTKEVSVNKYETTGKAFLNADQAFAAACTYLLTQLGPNNCLVNNQFKIVVTDAGGNAVTTGDTAVNVSVQVTEHVNFTLLKVLPDDHGTFRDGIDVSGSSTARAQCLDPADNPC